mgnify:CR=1 FL=1
MKIKLRLLIIGSFLLLSAQAHAGIFPFYWDVQGSAGFLGAPVAKKQSYPILVQTSVGASLGWEPSMLIPIFIGASSDMRWVEQYSAVDPTVGNWRGWRFNFISPLIGIRFLGFTLKTDAQLVGDYVLKNPNAAGQVIRFQRPLGMRVQFLRQVLPVIQAGIQGEYLTFRGQMNHELGAQSMSAPLRLWSVGLVLGVSL